MYSQHIFKSLQANKLAECGASKNPGKADQENYFLSETMLRYGVWIGNALSIQEDTAYLWGHNLFMISFAKRLCL